MSFSERKTSLAAAATLAQEIESMKRIRLPDVLKIIPVSSRTWWRMVDRKEAPPPVKFGSCSAWRLKDILALAENGTQT